MCRGGLCIKEEIKVREKERGMIYRTVSASEEPTIL